MVEPARNDAIRDRDLIPDPQSPIPGLYVHVPFCSSICNYCNFNRGLFDRRSKSLCRSGSPGNPLCANGSPCSRHVVLRRRHPSLLAPAEIAAIVDEARSVFGLVPGAEITLKRIPKV